MLHAKFQIIYSRFLGRSRVKIFTIYGDGGHLGHVTLTIYTNFRSPFQGMPLMEINGFSQCIAANKQQWCGLDAAASCGMVAACAFFICKLVFAALSCSNLEALSYSNLAGLSCKTLRLLVAPTLRLIVGGFFYGSLCAESV